MRKPVLVFDFDNTVTRGDLLDQLIERFSPNEEWKRWEAAWVEGRLSALECLSRQLRNMRVSRGELLAHACEVELDPWFGPIVRWAQARRSEILIVSDSFSPIIEAVLAHNGIEGLPVFANHLEFVGEDELAPSFPHHFANCARSANAKHMHLIPFATRPIVFAGDGRSDLDAALEATTVFAKDTLARELTRLAVPYHPFRSLEAVLAFLRSEYADQAPASKRPAEA